MCLEQRSAARGIWRQLARIKARMQRLDPHGISWRLRNLVRVRGKKVYMRKCVSEQQNMRVTGIIRA